MDPLLLFLSKRVVPFGHVVENVRLVSETIVVDVSNAVARKSLVATVPANKPAFIDDVPICKIDHRVLRMVIIVAPPAVK